MAKNLCEVRVPTYKRPHLLRRCLRSLISQDHENWVAIVMDDSPDQEGRYTVDELDDTRIHYRPNPQQLGCCGNIDQAFAEGSIAGGDFACVLEDDNWLLENCLKANMEALASSGERILLRNQRIALEKQEAVVEMTPKTTRGKVFSLSDRKLSPLQIRASICFSEGLSNGGIFWDLGCRSSFVVGPCVRFSPLQEFCRSLQLVESVFYAAAPLAVFSYPEDESTTREALDNRRFNRGHQSIISHLYNAHGTALFDTARELLQHSGEADSTAVLKALAGSRKLPPFTQISWPPWQAWLKGWAKRLTIADPLASYWKAKGLARTHAI